MDDEDKRDCAICLANIEENDKVSYHSVSEWMRNFICVAHSIHSFLSISIDLRCREGENDGNQERMKLFPLVRPIFSSGNIFQTWLIPQRYAPNISLFCETQIILWTVFPISQLCPSFQKLRPHFSPGNPHTRIIFELLGGLSRD